MRDRKKGESLSEYLAELRRSWWEISKNYKNFENFSFPGTWCGKYKEAPILCPKWFYFQKYILQTYIFFIQSLKNYSPFCQLWMVFAVWKNIWPINYYEVFLKRPNILLLLLLLLCIFIGFYLFFKVLPIQFLTIQVLPIQVHPIKFSSTNIFRFLYRMCYLL